MGVIITNFNEARAMFGDKIVVGAMNSTLNKTLTTVRKEAASQINKEYTIKVGDVKKAMKPRRSRFSSLFVELTSSDVRLPVARFKPTPRLGGVSVKIKRKEPRKILKRAFIANLKSGHVGVFTNHRYTRRKVSHRKRFPRRGPRPMHSELPIDAIFTLGTPQMWRLEQSEIVAKKRVETLFVKEMNFRLNKIGAKAK